MNFEDLERLFNAMCDNNLREDTPLIDAITDNNKADMLDLIQNGADVNKHGIRDTPLMAAIKSHNQFAVETLIESKCDLEAFGRGSLDSENALITTVKEANCDALDALIKAGCKINDCNLNFGLDNAEYTILHLGAELAAVKPSEKRLDILRILMNNIKESTMLSIDDKKDTALIKFIRRYGDVGKYSRKVLNYYELCVDVLTSKPKVITAQPWTLAFVIENGSVEACEMLLVKEENCVNLCFPDTGESPLHCAVRINSTRKCQLLVKYNARMNILWRGLNPLELAISLRCKDSIVDILQRHAFEQNVVVNAENLDFLTFNRQNENDLAFTQAQHIPKNKLKLKESQQITPSQYKKVTNTDIPYKYQNPNPEHVREIIATAHKCNYHREAKHILQYTEEILCKISHNFSKSPEKAHFQFETVYAGSMAEGTKTFTANEVDVILQFLENPKVGPHGKIDVPRESLWHAATCDEQLYIRTVAQSFYKAFQEELALILPLYNEADPETEVCLHRGSLDLKDKISCLQLLWRSQRYGDTIVHIDLVPAFNDPEYKPEKQMPTDAPISKQYHRIAKTSRHHFAVNIIFPDSHACAEVSFIHQLPANIKRGLIRAKALRIAAVSTPGDIESLNLADGETINAEDFVTSYMLKTCVIRLLRESPDTKGSELDWADRIYGRIQTDVENGRFETHYTESECIFECRHTTGGLPAGCCLKRQIIVAICKAIRKWICQNKAEMELQYGVVEVYSRKRHIMNGFLGKI